MFDKIIAYSVRNKFIIGLAVISLVFWGLYSLKQLPIDAVPDITNNQVQIITLSPTLATQEVEQFITTPIELSLQNLQQIEEVRSISRFGLSVITVVFEENYDIYLARQLVGERLREAQEAIPKGLGTPEISPLSTGLGEIYQYVVRPQEGFEDTYSPTELRSIQDWIVKRQLSGIEGVAEINSLGGFLKQYEVAVKPDMLKSMNISIAEVFQALESSNANTGGAYIEKNASAYYIRAEGLAKSLQDIGNIVVKNTETTPILIKNIATVQFGKAPRYGALVRDAKEVVGGKIMMYKGANASQVTALIKERMQQIQKSLPEGVVVEPFLVRDKLVKTAIGTVEKNLIEGGLIVVFILILFLGNWRAGLIVASVIPLAMLFAIAMMNMLGISANLMSLGAIDFGLIVDGAVIIVEAIIHRLQLKHVGKTLTKNQLNDEVIEASQKIRNSAAFGEIIILMVYIPILALVGIEGKMFKPMAQTVMLAIAGALVLSLTYVPMMASLFLKREVTNKRTIADKIMDFFQRIYKPMLRKALVYQKSFVGATIVLFLLSLFIFNRMGGEFIPTLEEGDLAMQHILPPGSSLSQSIKTSKVLQTKLLDEFPEIEDIVVNIGAAEIPTDPMPVEIGDYIIVMKPKSEWTSATSRQEMFEKFEEALHDYPGVSFEFSQPIQLRFNELMTGAKSDIAIKLFGDDLDILYKQAVKAQKIISQIEGVGTVNVEQTIGMPQIIINYKYDKMAQYGLHIKEVNQVIRTAFAGEKAGIIYEGEKRFDLVVRLAKQDRKGIEDVKNLYIKLQNGAQVPLSSVAAINLVNAPMQISRENTNRRITIGVNVGDTDVESLVEEIQDNLDDNLDLPTGYYFTYGGQFENLKAANARLSVAVPIALALIFILLFFTFGSMAQAALIFTAIPLSAIGGVWALQLRGLPFSISAGIGFIALFGVAVLNGIVLIGYFNQLKKEGIMDIKERIFTGTKVRLRPVLMTAAVASLGFLPMALSTSGGAEVQRPLATVVIGGLLTATFLTLIILPVLYYWLEKRSVILTKKNNKTNIISILLLVTTLGVQAQTPITLEEAVTTALANNPGIKASKLELKSVQSLQNIGYNLGATSIEYQGDGLWNNHEQQMNQFGITQEFPNPAITKASNILQDVLAEKALLTDKLTKKELIYQVEQLYYTIQYQKKQLAIYNEFVTTYDTYYNKAKIRVQSGETNQLESLSLLAKYNTYKTKLNKTKIQLSNLENTFQNVLAVKNAITTVDDFKINNTNIDYSDKPTIWLLQSEQDIALEKAKIKLLKATSKPVFTVGYAAQHYFEDVWLAGAKAGISFPVFSNKNKRKIKAQKLKVETAEQLFENEKLNRQTLVNKAINTIEMYKQNLQYYKEQYDVSPEILRVTTLNYQEGELGYLEVVNALETSVMMQLNYWQQLLAYHKAIAYYQYLTN